LQQRLHRHLQVHLIPILELSLLILTAFLDK
jgi:hypothetical protein